MESAAEAITPVLQTDTEPGSTTSEREHYPGRKYSALAVLNAAMQQEHPRDTYQQEAILGRTITSGRNLLTCALANADSMHLQVVTRENQVMHLIWTNNSTASISTLQASCMLALTAADAVLLYINDIQSNLAILLVLFQEKLKLVQNSSWIGKQPTTLYIATQQPNLMSGNIIKAFLVRLWLKASGQPGDDSFAQHFTMHVLGLSHSHFQGLDGYIDDCFDAGGHMSEEGDADKSRTPIATLLPADAHPCYVQRLWDQARSLSDSVLLDTVAAMADEICQSAAEEQMCIHRAKSDMCSGLSTTSQQPYLLLTVLLTLVANSLDDAMQGYEQALAYRFPRRTDSVPEDRRFRHLRRVKRQLWTSADAQKQLLKAKLISMAVQHTIRPWQMSMKQCHFQWLKQRIWGQSPGQDLGVASDFLGLELWREIHSNAVMPFSTLQTTCISPSLAELDRALASWMNSKDNSEHNPVSNPDSKTCEGRTFLQDHCALRRTVRASCELYKCCIFALHGWTVPNKHAWESHAQLFVEAIQLRLELQDMVDKACSGLQMAALAALKPISSDLKAAIFDMASIPVTRVAWV